MAQHDYVIDNAAGATVRADMNNLYQTIAEVNSGALEPATKFPYMFWADSTTNLLKQRNAGNTSWIVRNYLGSSKVLAKSANYNVTIDDFGSTINCTGTFTLSLTTVGTLGFNFWLEVKNSGTGIITIDPDVAELIDGSATLTLQPNEGVKVISTGSAFITVVRQSTIIKTESFVETARVSGTGNIPYDNTIPQSSEGAQYMSFTYTPKIINSTLRIESLANVAVDSVLGFSLIVALFKDGDVNALATGVQTTVISYGPMQVQLLYEMVTPSLTDIVFKIRAGLNSGNGVVLNGTTLAKLGSTLSSYIKVTEFI